MSRRIHNPGPATALALLCALTLYAPRLQAQAPTTPPPAAPPQAPTPQHSGILVDQVIAVVNGDLILESDVDVERRFQGFEPVPDQPAALTRDEAIKQLIDQALILQQAALQPGDEVTIAEAQADLARLRKDIPGCQPHRCDTDAEWSSFVTSQGFTVPELDELWRQRMEILKFVEIRFRAGIRISPEQIKTYYTRTLLPELNARHAPAPPLDSISDRIQEILLEQQVNNLLVDWLKTLKAEGSVRVMKPGEVAP